MKLIASARVGMMLAAMTMVAGCSGSRGAARALGAPPTTGTTSVTSAALSPVLAPMEPTEPINASTLVPAAWEDELEAVPAPPTWGALAVPPTTTATR